MYLNHVSKKFNFPTQRAPVVLILCLAFAHWNLGSCTPNKNREEIYNQSCHHKVRAHLGACSLVQGYGPSLCRLFWFFHSWRAPHMRGASQFSTVCSQSFTQGFSRNGAWLGAGSSVTPRVTKNSRKVTQNAATAHKLMDYFSH